MRFVLLKTHVSQTRPDSRHLDIVIVMRDFICDQQWSLIKNAPRNCSFAKHLDWAIWLLYDKLNK